MFLTNPQKGVIMKKSISILIFISAIAPLYGFYPGPLAKKKAALQEQVKTALAQKQIDKAQDLINQIQKETRDQALATTLQQELVAVKNQVEQARKAEDQRLLEQRKQAAQERGMIPVAQERKVAEERRLVPAGGQSEQQQRAELERKAAEDRRKLEEARQKAEQLRKEEEARKRADQERLAQAKAEEAKRAAAAAAAGNDPLKALGVPANARYAQILGVSDNASASEIRKAYQQLTLKWHPDRNPNNKELSQAVFQKVKEAYDVLISKFQ